MVRTTIMLSEELKSQAQKRADELGMPLHELIRNTLQASLDQVTKRREDDPLFADPPVFEGAVPADLSAEHDRYLYGEDA